MLVRPLSALAIALCAALLACAPTETAPATPSGSGTTRTAPPSVGPVRPPAASDSPSQTDPAELDPPLGWVRLGTLEEVSWVDRIVATGDGYVVVGATGENGDPAVWFSVDGRSWTRTDLWDGPRACGIYPYVTLGAASVDGVVLLGVEQEGLGACVGHVASWHSADGRTWRRSADFGTASLVDGIPAGVWAIDEGWEAAIGDASGRHGVWTSADGLTWSRRGDLEMAGEISRVAAVAVDSTGRRLMSIASGDLDPAFSDLYASNDGVSWAHVDGPGPDAGVVDRILAPSVDDGWWVAVATTLVGDRPTTTIWVSENLTTWVGVDFPLNEASDVLAADGRIIASATDACYVTGGPCEEPDRTPRYLTSADGLEWRSLGAAGPRMRLADGPVGVLGVADDGATYGLVPYTDDEWLLLAGFRDDARFACAPRRTDLPPRSLAGVVCSPDPVAGEPADEVGAYLMGTPEDMLSTYRERLGAENIAVSTGDCPRTEGDSAYMPHEAGDAASPARNGCFVNEFGNANIRLTYPDAAVYVGALGRGRDMAPLWNWVWKDNLDVPGAPTIWRSTAP